MKVRESDGDGDGCAREEKERKTEEGVNGQGLLGEEVQLAA